MAIAFWNRSPYSSISVVSDLPIPSMHRYLVKRVLLLRVLRLVNKPKDMSRCSLFVFSLTLSYANRLFASAGICGTIESIGEEHNECVIALIESELKDHCRLPRY